MFVPISLNQFQSDLGDAQDLGEHNDRFNYLLTDIDVFSKNADWIRGQVEISGPS